MCNTQLIHYIRDCPTNLHVWTRSSFLIIWLIDFYRWQRLMKFWGQSKWCSLDFEHQGNYEEAYKWMDVARNMDTADRYLNTKCTRFAFRAGSWRKGEWTIRQFLRPSDGLECIEELQVVWYPTAKGIGHSMFLQHRKALEQFERNQIIFLNSLKRNKSHAVNGESYITNIPWIYSDGCNRFDSGHDNGVNFQAIEDVVHHRNATLS